MNQLLNLNHELIMSSREIADLVEKRHDNVKRTINMLVEKCVISKPQIEDGIKKANGFIEKEYLIGKRDSYAVVAQLSPEFTARLVDRWQELEEKQSNAVIEQTQLDKDIKIADWVISQNRIEGSSKLLVQQKVVSAHTTLNLLPYYVVDSSSVSVSGSSETTASATTLLRRLN